MSNAERQYQEIFEHTPVALWQEDYTETCAHIERLRAQGITDWPAYFDEHPEKVRELASRVQILDINQYALKLFRAKSKEDLLISIDRVFDPESMPSCKDQLIALAGGDRHFETEVASRTLQGQRLHLLRQIQIIRSHDSCVRGLVSLIDISRRKEMEVELRAMNLELERSNQDLEHFAYLASHDLQEPLRMISSYTQLLARRYQGQLDEKADKFIHYIVDGAKRMQALIGDLLELSRVGTASRTLRPVDCAVVLDRVLANLSGMLEERGGDVTHDDLPTVFFDSSQLGLLLQNLISNALKFRGKQAPRVHVSARKEGRMWILAIRDNGIGIADKHHEEVFEIFRRLHLREEYPGTGVGLAIAKKIVERHGGTIWLESAPGKGSTFYFSVMGTN
ncbi:MAG: ATP-binding protein [Proteobacteria bacterium]|nr:ATP-binding protein [Pseudomonadota bacterium]